MVGAASMRFMEMIAALAGSFTSNVGGSTVDLTVANFLDRCLTIALQIQNEKGKRLKDSEEGLKGNKELGELRSNVEAWASKYGYPGFSRL